MRTIVSLSIWALGLMLAVIPVGQATESTSLTPMELFKAQTMMEKRCGVCHKPYKPENFSLKEWPGIINKMGPKASLRRSEMDLLLRYIEYSAKKAKSTATEN